MTTPLLLLAARGERRLGVAALNAGADDFILPPLSMAEFVGYATDKGMRRLGTISSARGRAVAEIDFDYSPLELEDTFAAEDHRALTAAAH